MGWLHDELLVVTVTTPVSSAHVVVGDVDFSVTFSAQARHGLHGGLVFVLRRQQGKASVREDFLNLHPRESSALPTLFVGAHSTCALSAKDIRSGG